MLTIDPRHPSPQPDGWPRATHSSSLTLRTSAPMWRRMTTQQPNASDRRKILEAESAPRPAKPTPQIVKVVAACVKQHTGFRITFHGDSEVANYLAQKGGLTQR